MQKMFAPVLCHLAGFWLMCAADNAELLSSAYNSGPKWHSCIIACHLGQASFTVSADLQTV